jgi:hypothetical protein
MVVLPLPKEYNRELELKEYKVEKEKPRKISSNGTILFKKTTFLSSLDIWLSSSI